MEAAESRMTGSSRRVAPPRKAPTPTFSTTLAVAAMVETSVRTESKLKVQLVTGCAPNDWIAAWSTVMCVDSSDAIF